MVHHKMKQTFSKKSFVAIAVFVFIGIITLFVSRAATPTASIQPESGSITGGSAAPISASGASGTAVKFAPANTGGIAPPNIAPAAGKTWSLNFSEEFSGTSVDLNKWTTCFSWAWDYAGCTASFNEGREYYQSSQVQYSNGIGKLVAQPQSPSVWGKDYKSGLLSTTNKPNSLTGGVQGPSLYKFKYGYVEARLKLPPQKGFFTAFWMLPVSTAASGYQYPYEIDILENLGGGDTPLYQTIHYNGRSQNWSPFPSGDCSPTVNPFTDFHTYGVDWQAGYLDFYIDGKKCGRFTQEVWSSEMEIILNLMVDVTWQKFWAPLYGATGTGVLEADYVRVWQYK
jgi:beta-glucanase (GH16 family)